MRSSSLSAGLLLLVLGCGPRATPTAPPTSVPPASVPGGEAPEAASEGTVSGKLPPSGKGAASGVFDFYVLALSWSPQFCATRTARPDDPQCGDGRRFGFIAHGLWPQYVLGYPESCPTTQSFDAGIVPRILEVMPSERLIRHEWERHGSCSGLSAGEYFTQLERLYRSVHIPERFTYPAEEVTTTLADFKQSFMQANPGLQLDMFAVLCASGGFLREIRVCYSKQGEVRPCMPAVRDQCRDGRVAIRPPRAALTQ